MKHSIHRPENSVTRTDFGMKIKKLPAWFTHGMSLVLGITMGLGFVLFLWYARPRTEFVPIEPAQKVVFREVVVPMQQKFSEQELRNLVRQGVEKVLRENMKGIVRLQDGVALTVHSKRAAIGNKTGFVDLDNFIKYELHCYFTHKDNAYAIADDGEMNLFLVEFLPGKVKVPITNPGKLRFPQGIRADY